MRPARKEASCPSVLLHPVLTVEPCRFVRPAASVTVPVASLSSLWKLSGASPQLLVSRFCPAQCGGILKAPRDRV